MQYPASLPFTWISPFLVAITHLSRFRNAVWECCSEQSSAVWESERTNGEDASCLPRRIVISRLPSVQMGKIFTSLVSMFQPSVLSTEVSFQRTEPAGTKGGGSVKRGVGDKEECFCISACKLSGARAGGKGKPSPMSGVISLSLVQLCCPSPPLCFPTFFCALTPRLCALSTPPLLEQGTVALPSSARPTHETAGPFPLLSPQVCRPGSTEQTERSRDHETPTTALWRNKDSHPR